MRVTNVYDGVPETPKKVRELCFRRTSKGVSALLQTGNPFYIVEGIGKTNAEAEEDARKNLAELRAKNGMDVDGSERVAA